MRQETYVIFTNQLVTIADLEVFKTDMLDEIRKIFKKDHGLPTKNGLNRVKSGKCWSVNVSSMKSNKPELNFCQIG